MDCSVCLGLVTGANELEIQGVAGWMDVYPVITQCGHLFHRSCLNETWRNAEGRGPRCPSCNVQVAANGLIPFRGGTDSYDAALSPIRQELLNLEEQQLRAEEDRSKLSRFRANGFEFITPEIINADATCFSYESVEHLTRACPKPVIVHFSENVAGNNSAPTVRICRTVSAGELVKRFEDAIALGRNVRRDEFICLANLWSSGTACPACGSWTCVLGAPRCSLPSKASLAFIIQYFQSEVLQDKRAWFHAVPAP